jgi:hypothetical protein
MTLRTSAAPVRQQGAAQQLGLAILNQAAANAGQCLCQWHFYDLNVFPLIRQAATRTDAVFGLLADAGFRVIAIKQPGTGFNQVTIRTAVDKR